VRGWLAIVALAASGCAAPQKPAPAELVLVGASVITTDPEHPRAEAVAVRGGKIAAVGPRGAIAEWIGPRTETRDLGGAWVLPGLTDAHAHLAGLGDSLANLDLSGTRSFDEVLARVAARAKEQPEGWLVGRGWDQNDWPGAAFPDGAELERAAPGRAVWLRRVDGHAGLASPEALRIAGIGAETTDPAGGRILRRSDGSPSGVLVDTAMALVDAKVPAPSAAERRARLVRALDVARSVGITEVHDMGTTPETLEILRELERTSSLPLRVYVVLQGTDPRIETLYAAGPASGERLSVRAVKFFADGALGSRGALLSTDYADDPGNRGLHALPPDELRARIGRAVSAGFQPCVHAIGDQANALVLDAYAALRARSLRPRIEHAQVLGPTDIARFRTLGVIASMQPTHATSDMPWAEARVGRERIRGAYAWRSLLSAGAPIAFGSDFPVERPEILEGVYAAVARADRAGNPPGGWYPAERLTFAEALAGFTSGAAYAAFVEDRRGRIRAGYDADFTIVEGDLGRADADPSVLLKARVRATLVAGR
jgi:predicted amidohydrolase YtcJ